jgi:hypothetical protein
MLTRDTLKKLISDNGWKCTYNRKDFSLSENVELRAVVLEIEVPYERSSTSAAQSAIMKGVMSSLGCKRIDLGVGEWTNEDGGDCNLLTQEFSVSVAV